MISPLQVNLRFCIQSLIVSEIVNNISTYSIIEELEAK